MTWPKGTLRYIHYPIRDLLKATPVKAGSHNLRYHINDLHTEKNPAQQWLELQATCSLGIHLGSHTLRPSLVYYLFPVTACINSDEPHQNWLLDYKAHALAFSVEMSVTVIVKCIWKIFKYTLLWHISIINNNYLPPASVLVAHGDGKQAIY